MHKIAPYLFALAALGACSDDDDDFVPIGGTVDEFVVWSADIVGFGPYPTIGGTADVVHVLGSDAFSVDASIFGDVPGAVRPWHVHFGTCGSGGGIVGFDEDYPPFVTDGFGEDFVSLIVPEFLDPAAAYHVNFHLSPDDLDILIACGDLFLQ